MVDASRPSTLIVHVLALKIFWRGRDVERHVEIDHIFCPAGGQLSKAICNVALSLARLWRLELDFDDARLGLRDCRGIFGNCCVKDGPGVLQEFLLGFEFGAFIFRLVVGRLIERRLDLSSELLSGIIF
jgi:hypothetical protein